MLELVEGGSLASCIYTSPPTIFEPKRALSVLRSICVGCEFIHLQNQLHLDIKSSNVLVSRDFSVVKLSDFGSSQELRDTLGFLTMGSELTLRWAAPERLDGIAKLSCKADIYSIGMVLVEMLTGKRPLPDVDDLKVTAFVLNQKVLTCLRLGISCFFDSFLCAKVSTPPHRDAFCRDVMLNCCRFKASERPTASQLVQRI